MVSLIGYQNFNYYSVATKGVCPRDLLWRRPSPFLLIVRWSVAIYSGLARSLTRTSPLLKNAQHSTLHPMHDDIVWAKPKMRRHVMRCERVSRTHCNAISSWPDFKETALHPRDFTVTPFAFPHFYSYYIRVAFPWLIGWIVRTDLSVASGSWLSSSKGESSLSLPPFWPFSLFLSPMSDRARPPAWPRCSNTTTFLLYLKFTTYKVSINEFLKTIIHLLILKKPCSKRQMHLVSVGNSS